jgi:prepilin-type N-terminal cleavage/methylation domain-containing protein
MRKSKGFTLIELMIVVAIIGILSAIAIPKFADLIRKSNEGATKGNLGALRSAISIYYGEMEGFFPAGSLDTVLTMDNGKYIKEMPEANCPPYHGKTKSVTVAVSSADEANGAGFWGYQDNTSPAAGEKAWGDLWVNCTHTDSKSTQWGQY